MGGCPSVHVAFALVEEQQRSLGEATALLQINMAGEELRLSIEISSMKQRHDVLKYVSHQNEKGRPRNEDSATRVTLAHRENIMKATCLVVGVAMALASEAAAEQPDRSRLVGSTIYSADGAEVGTIADIRLDEGGRLVAVRVDAAARLGFGTRRVELPGRAVTIVRGVPVLDVPKDAVEMLPSLDADRATPDH